MSEPWPGNKLIAEGKLWQEVCIKETGWTKYRVVPIFPIYIISYPMTYIWEGSEGALDHLWENEK